MKPQSMEEKISYRLFFMGFVGLLRHLNCVAFGNAQD